MKIEMIKEAYRKLKGSIYWDKTLAHLRKSIVEFEMKELEQKLQQIDEALRNDQKWESLETKVLNSIGAFTFPKKIDMDESHPNKPIVLSNISSYGVKVKEYNNFIDMSIEGHIIGVLWILTIGYKLDKKLLDECKGNRLNDTLVLNDQPTESPNLFKPYYEQYSSWRNKGLDKASNIVNEDKSSVIISMLDLSRYYYSIRISKVKFEKYTNIYINNNQEIKRINDLLFKILETYSKILGVENDVLLPIGFLPSGILSNFYLDTFDRKLIQETEYYGRYVDDILLVTKVTDNGLKNRIQENGIDEVVRYMKDYFVKNNILSINDEEFFVVGYKNLHIKQSKLRFFYIDSDGSDIIIETIKRDIEQNVSEFNFLPEDTVTDLEENVVKLERDDTVNKIRGVYKASVDKYALSKIIGKNQFAMPYVNQEKVDAFIKQLEQVLNHRELISNYLLWESILNYYVTNQEFNGLLNFTHMVTDAISEMDEEAEKTGDYAYLKGQRIKSVENTLYLFYFSCLARATAIVWGKPIAEILGKIERIVSSHCKDNKCIGYFTVQRITEIRKKYCISRMIRKNLLPVIIDECLACYSLKDDKEKIECLFSLEEYLSVKEQISRRKSEYTPYIVAPFDILYGELLKTIKNENTEIKDDEKLLKLMFNAYLNNFGPGFDSGFLRNYFHCERNENNSPIIRIDSDIKKSKTGKTRIAIANVRTDENDLKAILKEEAKDLSGRSEEINEIVNEAIRHKSDILVFPEAYIPIACLRQLQKKAAKNKMTIIGGIEHIKHGDKVYNFTTTIIPVKKEKITYAVPFFHLKEYYAPEEEKLIRGENLVPVVGKSHTLFDWNNVRFASFCCFELTAIRLRTEFKREADVIIGVEWNKDTNYFSNIMESLSRDLSCYCVQANVSEYGDSRIIQPTSSVFMNIARIKGGINASVIIGEIDIPALRDHHEKGRIKETKEEKEKVEKKREFSPLPADF